MDNLKVQLLLTIIHQYGVRDICIGSGSRSTKLIAMINTLDVNVYPFFDERALGYFALGIIKAKQAPVLVITTSGTAVSNLCPAVTEAYHDHLNLIVCTADRPTHCLRNGANQTINQVNIFNSVLDEVQINEDITSKGVTHIATQLNNALSKMKTVGGPIHINCRLEDPVKSEPFKRTNIDGYLNAVNDCKQPYLSQKNITSLNDQINNSESGLLCVGQIENSEDKAHIDEFVRTLGWTTIVDVTNLPMKKHANVVQSTDAFILNQSTNNYQTILYIGGRFVSKKLYEQLATRQNAVIHISHQYLPTRPNQHKVESYQSTYKELKSLEIKNSKTVISDMNQLNAAIDHALLRSIEMNPTSDVAYIKAIIESITSATDIFVSNSLPVRVLDHLFNEHITNVYVNRGASGIDGNISTVMGICQEKTEVPIVVLIGDLASLVDINAILLMNKSKRPAKIFVINNGGGDIFSLLPVVNQTDNFNQFLKMSHSYSVSRIATGFGIKSKLITHPNQIGRTKDMELIECDSTGGVQLSSFFKGII